MGKTVYTAKFKADRVLEVLRKEEELLKTVGQLTLERDWLKKTVEVFGSDYEKKFSKKTF